MKFNISLDEGDLDYGEVTWKGEWPTTKRAAIKASIAKWEVVVDALENGLDGIPDVDSYSCALCQIYVDLWNMVDGTRCSGCPVKKKTGKPECFDTPFYDFWEAEDTKTALKHARRMVKFLKAL